MTPTNFAGALLVLRAPAGMEEEVEELPIWSDGHRVVSRWEPTEEERAAIAGGAAVRLVVWMGGAQPPVSLDVFPELEYLPAGAEVPT